MGVWKNWNQASQGHFTSANAQCWQLGNHTREDFHLLLTALSLCYSWLKTECLGPQRFCFYLKSNEAIWDEECLSGLLFWPSWIRLEKFWSVPLGEVSRGEGDCHGPDRLCWALWSGCCVQYHRQLCFGSLHLLSASMKILSGFLQLLEHFVGYLLSKNIST